MHVCEGHSLSTEFIRVKNIVVCEETRKQSNTPEKSNSIQHHTRWYKLAARYSLSSFVRQSCFHISMRRVIHEQSCAYFAKRYGKKLLENSFWEFFKHHSIVMCPNLAFHWACSRSLANVEKRCKPPEDKTQYPVFQRLRIRCLS